MIRKVLIVDDHEDVNKSVLNILHSHGITNVHSSQYCDDAFLKIKKGDLDSDPFDLVITDLSFKPDHRTCNLCSGEELIAFLRKDYENLPIIVYSMNDQLQKVRHLFKDYHVNAYVCKDRKGASELEEAVTAIINDKQFLSPQIATALSPKSSLEITDYDIELVKQLSLGLDQKEISAYFLSINYKPNSISTIEKKLNKLRLQFKANNAIHLVSKMKDLGLI